MAEFNTALNALKHKRNKKENLLKDDPHFSSNCVGTGMNILDRIIKAEKALNGEGDMGYQQSLADGFPDFVKEIEKEIEDWKCRK